MPFLTKKGSKKMCLDPIMRKHYLKHLQSSNFDKDVEEMASISQEIEKKRHEKKERKRILLGNKISTTKMTKRSNDLIYSQQDIILNANELENGNTAKLVEPNFNNDVEHIALSEEIRKKQHERKERKKLLLGSKHSTKKTKRSNDPNNMQHITLDYKSNNGSMLENKENLVKSAKINKKKFQKIKLKNMVLKSKIDHSLEDILEDNNEKSNNVESLYKFGEIIWARIDGYPWWPAMVENDPNVDSWYWFEETSNIPTWYHCTFFDSEDVTRAWVKPQDTKSFEINTIRQPIFKKFENRLNFSIKQADIAKTLNVAERLETFSFLKRYKGKIVLPDDE